MQQAVLTPELEQAILAFIATCESEKNREVVDVSASEVGTPTASAMEDDGKPQEALWKQAGETGATILKRLAPFGLQVAVSAAAYTTGLGLFQLLGMGLRVSCQQRIISSCIGCVGVGVSSAFAGHMSRYVQRQYEKGHGPLAPFKDPIWSGFRPEDALLDAIVGMMCFKVGSGRFAQLMPSDLRKPGAFGYNSVPVPGSTSDSGAKYALGDHRAMLATIFKRDGCHHCGSHRGPLIGDHIPPTKLFKEMRAAAQAAQGQPPHMLQEAVNKIKELLHLKAPLLRQRYFAQCGRCSNKQAQLLRHGNRLPLVMHRWLITPGVAPGVLAGLWHCTLRDPGSGPGSGGQATTTRSKVANQEVGRSSTRGFLPWGRSSLAQKQAGEAVEEVVVAEMGSEDDEDDVRCGALWAMATRMDGTGAATVQEMAVSSSTTTLPHFMPSLHAVASHQVVGGEGSLVSTPRTRGAVATPHATPATCTGPDQDHTTGHSHIEVHSPRSTPLKAYGTPDHASLSRVSYSSPMSAIHSSPMSKARIMRALYQSLAASKDAGAFGAVLPGPALAPA